MDSRTLGLFLGGDLLAALVVIALILAGQTILGIVLGVIIVLVATGMGVQRLRSGGR
jgi:hypothetical protein